MKTIEGIHDLQVVKAVADEPREVVCGIEHSATLPAGEGDRFAGYSVMGLPFHSGHVLALRRFPASSVGPSYTSVWHRDPDGRWTFYSTIAPDQDCSKYFGQVVDENIVTSIRLQWRNAYWLRVIVEGDRPLTWDMTLAESPASRAMNFAGRLVPESWWQKPLVLKVMSLAARLFLGTGPMNLSGRTPNGYTFVANPQQMWLIRSSRAVINGEHIGRPAPLKEQARLKDLLIPQRGIFAIGRAFLRDGRQVGLAKRAA
jgi:hypothetical protein